MRQLAAAILVLLSGQTPHYTCSRQGKNCTDNDTKTGRNPEATMHRRRESAIAEIRARWLLAHTACSSYLGLEAPAVKVHRSRYGERDPGGKELASVGTEKAEGRGTIRMIYSRGQRRFLQGSINESEENDLLIAAQRAAIKRGIPLVHLRSNTRHTGDPRLNSKSAEHCDRQERKRRRGRTAGNSGTGGEVGEAAAVARWRNSGVNPGGKGATRGRSRKRKEGGEEDHDRED
ncbi:hypothetical protein KM043_011446 [Ampulex compressa]|nr:hypothetical protein KM043_011446 [Ampulex compressa]